MATIKKSPKAKTKTAATRATKTTKTTTKRATAKVTKKTVAAKVVKKPTMTTDTLLTRLHILSAFVAVALAGVAAWMMNATKFELTIGGLAKNELAAQGATTLVPAVSHVYDVEIRWLVVITLALGAILPLLTLTVYKARFTAAIRDRVNLLRWIDVAVISALMVEIIALLSGVNDILTLKLLAGLMAVTSLLGWVSEKRNKQAGRPAWSEFVVSLVTGMLPWILIAGYAVNTWVQGRTHNEWYVYALYAAVMAGFIGYSYTLYRAISRRDTNVATIERNYLIVSILLKTAFGAILIAGLR